MQHTRDSELGTYVSVADTSYHLAIPYADYCTALKHIKSYLRPLIIFLLH